MAWYQHFELIRAKRKPLLIEPRWLSYEVASAYCCLSATHLRVMVRRKLIKSKLVCLPGAGRGRRLIDRLSLDEFIENSGDEARQTNLTPAITKP